jgi:hypothetical protein
MQNCNAVWLKSKNRDLISSFLSQVCATLLLGHNHLGDRGAATLAEMLLKTKAKDEGAGGAALALSLTKLDLSANAVGDAGAAALALSLEAAACTLRSLSLRAAVAPAGPGAANRVGDSVGVSHAVFMYVFYLDALLTCSVVLICWNKICDWLTG